MDNNANRSKQEVLIKILAPLRLKADLQALAHSRNVSLSAIVRIALSEYVKNQQ